MNEIENLAKLMHIANQLKANGELDAYGKIMVLINNFLDYEIGRIVLEDKNKIYGK